MNYLQLPHKCPKCGNISAYHGSDGNKIHEYCKVCKYKKRLKRKGSERII